MLAPGLGGLLAAFTINLFRLNRIAMKESRSPAGPVKDLPLVRGVSRQPQGRYAQAQRTANCQQMVLHGVCRGYQAIP
jgi:hypothetical protein